MEVKVIMENKKDLFENEIKTLLKIGYEIKASNISFLNKIELNNTFKNLGKNLSTVLSDKDVCEICFYAILVKDNTNK